jgi:S-formylglutathione hydrolase FrmB
MHRPRNRRLAGAAIAAVSLGTITALAAPAPAAPHRPDNGASHANAGVTFRNAHGVKVDKVQRVGARQLQVTITPKALAHSLGVRIILPKGYRANGDRRYPTLYLFPGTSGHSTDWSTSGDAPKTTRPYPLITVTSDIGFNGDGGSWFSNWVDRTTSMGKAQWETYNVHQLIPWIDANLATIRNRSGRAVAGLSQGGYGAAIIAARYPDKFTEMGSFSGAPEIDRALTARAGALAVIDATMVGLNQVPADAPFGNHLTDEINWKGHDPAYLIRNLRGVGLWFATADGAPGKYDDPVTDPTGYLPAAGIESLTHFSTEDFVHRAHHVDVPVQVYDYNSGTHTWPYWARDLRHFMKPLMHRFAHSQPRPNRVHYISTEKSWSSFGWHVRFTRSAPLAWGSIHHANRYGFRVKGTGIAHVMTANRFAPHRTYRVKAPGAHAVSRKADQHGRLHISVLTGTKGQRSTRVSITRKR